ncbi:MAG: RNA-binding protein [Rhizobiales bacterium]|nr:RNA-binding protein [Hyphomicrobiales bacterium]
MQQPVETITEQVKPEGLGGKPSQPRRRAARRGTSVAATASMTRKCIVTGESKDCAELIRFAIGPEGEIAPDLFRKLGGRGVWVTATREDIERACAKKAFNRAFSTNVVLPDDLPGLIDVLLQKSMLESLGMARKAGQIITGQGRLDGAIRSGGIALVLHASDGAKDGMRKTGAALHAMGLRDEVPVIDIFTSAQMSLVLGLSNVVHAGMPSGGLSSAILEKYRRLLRYRATSPDTNNSTGN